MKLETIDSSRGLVVQRIDEYACLNLNSLIRTTPLNTNIKHILTTNLKDITYLNLNNLCSACYKLGLDYMNIDEVANLINPVIAIIKDIRPDIHLTQNNISCFYETDCNAFDTPFLLTSDKICIIKPLRDIFTLLGFTNQQILTTLETYKYKVMEFLPKDLTNRFYIKNERTSLIHDSIKRLL